MTKVMLCLSLKSRKSLCKRSDVLLSKFPVGSSAKITFGLFISALATATLCCSPPESSEGY